MISNSGHDENGKYSGGKAGDQTGTEWQIISWYDRPWNVVLRYPNRTVAQKFADKAAAAAKNNNIGYDQNQRTTFWTQLAAAGYDPAKITVPCEGDCSAGVAAIIKATGYELNIEDLKNVSKDSYTGNLRSVLTKAGFQALTDSKYRTSDAYLMPGDVLLYEGHHTAINLDYGAKAKPEEPQGQWEHLPNGQWKYKINGKYVVKGWQLINHHWYYFENTIMKTGVVTIGSETFYLMTSGDLEGACCITNSRGALNPWYVE